MTFEPIKTADSIEQHSKNGRIIALENISPELRLYIIKLISGLNYYVNKRYYFEQIDRMARKEGLSDVAVGMLIRQAAKKAFLSYSTVSRHLPDRYKDKQKQLAALLGVEKRRSSACKMQPNHYKNVQEESGADREFRKSELYQSMTDKLNMQQAELQSIYHAKYVVDLDLFKHNMAIGNENHSAHWYMESEFVRYDREKNTINLEVTRFE